MAMSLLGIDVGTSAAKGLLIDDQGRVLGQASRGYRMATPHPGWAELSASRVWAAVREVIGALGRVGDASGAPVLAICVGGSGDDVVAVDVRGRPVAPVIMALDQRSVAEGRAVADACGATALYTRTGLWDLATAPLVRFRWLQLHAPASAARVVHLLSWPEWVATRLGLPPVVDPTLAARSLAYDLVFGGYAPAACLAGLAPDELLSPVVATGTVVGAIDRRVAPRLGLRDGTRFVVGGFDQAMATLGAGALEPGIAHDGSGSWEALSVRIARGPIDPRLGQAAWSVGPTAIGSERLELMTSWVGGLALRWVAGLTTGGMAGDAALRRVLEHLPPGHARTTAVTDLAAHGPPPLAGGAGIIAGLDLGTRHEDLVLSVLDGLAHRLRRAVHGLGALGIPVRSIRATGGGARSDRWLQLKADTTGLPIERPSVEQAGAFAAAVLAGSALGVLPPPETAIRELVRVVDRFEPDPSAHAWHEERAARHDALGVAIEQLEGQ
jgi:xylulokinase